MKSKKIRGLRRRSPRLKSLKKKKKKKKKVVLFLKKKEIWKKKMNENGERPSRLKHFAPGSETTGFLRRSPRLQNVSCNLKPQAVLKKKSAKLGKTSTVKHILKTRFVQEPSIISSSEVKLPLEETELFREAVRVLNKGLTNKGLTNKRRSTRKRREFGFEKLIISIENKESKQIENKEELSEDYKDISCVNDLLMTGRLEGALITFISEKNQVKLPGVITGTGYLCGCTKCNYAEDVLSAQEYNIHASGCDIINPNNYIFLSNELSIFELDKRLKSVHKNALKYELDKIVSKLEFQKPLNQQNDNKKRTKNDLKKSKSIEASKQFIKCYKRYTPKSLLKDVQGLLSTGLLEGFQVTYENKQARLKGFIRGKCYECGCSSCNYTQVITVIEFERHAGANSKNQNNYIYLDNGISIFKLVKELQNTRLNLLNDIIESKIGRHPNYKCFEVWKGSFQVGDGIPNSESNSEKRPDVQIEHFSVQSKSRDEEPVSEAINSADSNSNHDNQDPPNGDSISTIQEIPTSEPTKVTKTDINVVSKGHTNKCSTDPSPKELVSGSIKNNLFKCNVGPALIGPGTPGPSKSNTQPNQISEPIVITDSAEIAFNDTNKCNMEPSLIGPGPPGPHIEVKTDPTTNSVSKYGFEIETADSNVGPSSLVHDTPGPSNKGLILRKARSPRFLRFKIRDKECNAHATTGNHLNQSGVVIFKSSFENRADCNQNSSQKVRFICNDIKHDERSAIEDPDWNQNKSRLKARLSDEKGGTVLKKRGRDASLHRRVFEEGGLPDGTVLTYRIHNKVAITGYKHGETIVCACHNCEMKPSQFEAHAGMAQRRKPYHNIYISDGRTLHDMCLELASIRKPISEVQVKCTIPCNDYSRHISIIPTNCKLIQVLQTQKGTLISCSICKDSSTVLGDEKHSKLIIFCNQCNKAYHTGCLENKESVNIEDVFNKRWFCCTNCTWINTGLKDLCTNGSNPVPSPFLDLLKRQNTEKNSVNNIEWQIFSGKNTQDEMLLLQALQVLKSAFKPISEGEKNLIRSMVFGKAVIRKAFDFSGMHCIAIKVDGNVVSIALLRVFGQIAAEIPLVTTSKLWRRKGYFRLLLSLIEELLGLLKVRLIIAPVHDKMQSIWIDKFGFFKSADQKVQMLKEQHSIMVFENLDILEKAIPA